MAISVPWQWAPERDHQTPEVDPLFLTEFREAIAVHQIQLVFQPIFDVTTGRIVGAEALSRWVHPGFGTIPPSNFIPIAEAAGLMSEFGDYVLHKACASAKHLCSEEQPFWLHVNISASQLRDGQLVDRIVRMLEQTQFPAASLCLELTEGVAMSATTTVMSNFEQLSALGIQFCLDDFGTEYASYHWLLHYPVSALKVDKSLVDSMPDGVRGRAIVRSLRTLASDLALRVVVEGVETAEQMQILRDEQFTELQGFYLGRPMPVEVLSERMMQQLDGHPHDDHLTSTLTFEQMQRKLADFEWLERCMQPAFNQEDVFSVMASVRELFAERFSFDRFGILVGTVNDKYCVIHELVTRDDMEACPPGSLMIVKGTGLEHVYQTKALHYNPDIRLRPEFLEDEELASIGLRSMVRVPLMLKDEVIGVMTVKTVEPNYYSTEDIELMNAVAKRLGYCIYHLKQNYRLKLTSYQDALTKIFNRRFFVDAFASPESLDLVYELTAVDWPEEELAATVLFIDINQFKVLNDLAGHAVGDQLLAFAAKMIQDAAGSEGFAVRYGGDEFVVVFPGADADKAEAMARRLNAQARTSRLPLSPEIQWGLSFSVGIAAGPLERIENLVGQADAKMYEEKERVGLTPANEA